MTKLTPTDLQIRQEIQNQLDALGWTQTRLAQQIRENTGKKVLPPNVHAIISGERGLIPQMLLDLLDAVGLKLVAVPVTEDEREAAPAKVV